MLIFISKATFQSNLPQNSLSKATFIFACFIFCLFAVKSIYEKAIAYYLFNVIPTVLYCNKTNDSIFCILNFDDVKCHFYCSRIDTKKQSNCLFVNDETTYSYDDIAKELIIHKKGEYKKILYDEYPLSNQLRYMETKFISDLHFGENVHKILSLILN